MVVNRENGDDGAILAVLDRDEALSIRWAEEEVVDRASSDPNWNGQTVV